MPTFPHRKLGDLSVSALGLGCMGMSNAYGPADRTESLATINAALDAGVNFLDTAELYGAGHNESLVGEVLKHRRDEVVIATKFGITPHPETKMPNGLDGSAANARRAIDGSLQRLGVDVIDLYYLHRVDPEVPIEESVGAMAEFVTAGKVRALGLSEASPEALRRAAAVHPIAALQSEWSLFSRDLEDEIVPTARELGIALVPYSPLGRGLLTGAIAATTDLADNDFRRTLPRWQAENLDRNLALVQRIRDLADDLSTSPGRIALAWLLAQGDDVVPIPGTRRRTNLEDNLGAVDVRLSETALASLDALVASGDRYPDMAWVAGRSA
ncbi:aldo/keto reductase [Microlunatus parietis]|uniref:Aryl-alcohol dehydrogenase-like predicted oxidoreductase n=1 Tax=Microlunatus parietis TaxID=682979 RepID=A0A7Y9ICH3_9ACTN|nr:aldo/keto reductase [Microlunatus parietis]NYE73759.1 aryl-alcohol dehydrogenase-like predicted oxidoreductase [Microlunatus parietis]